MQKGTNSRGDKRVARGAHPPPVHCQRQLPSCSRSASRHLYGQRKDLKDKRDSWRVPKGHLVQPPAALLCLQEVLRKIQSPTCSFEKHPNIGEEGEQESNQAPPHNPINFPLPTQGSSPLARSGDQSTKLKAGLKRHTSCWNYRT